MGGYVTVCSEPWGLATMFDAYFGFLAFWLYVAWHKQTIASRLGWFVALRLLGDFAIAAYALLCLFRAKGETDLGKVFFTRKVARMGRVSDWLRRKVRDPLLAELRQGATPEAVSAAVTISFAIAIVLVIGVTTLGCVVVGRIFRLNHVVMQIVNHASYPLQVLLIVPFVRLGETLSGARHFALTPEAIIGEFNRSVPDFLEKFWLTGLHGLIGWAVTVPLACWLLHFILRRTFRRLLPKPSAP